MINCLNVWVNVLKMGVKIKHIIVYESMLIRLFKKDFIPSSKHVLCNHK